MLIPSLSLVSLPSSSRPLVRVGHKTYASEGYSDHERLQKTVFIISLHSMVCVQDPTMKRKRCHRQVNKKQQNENQSPKSG